MAKGEQRGNREAKKPKQTAPKSTPAVSPFSVTPAKPNVAQRPNGGKK